MLEVPELSYILRRYQSYVSFWASAIIESVCISLFLLRLLGLWWWNGFELLRLPRFGSFADLFPRRESLEVADDLSSLRSNNGGE